MRSANLIRVISVLTGATLGCGSEVVPVETTPEPEPNTYVLDFSSSEAGGVRLGGNSNLAFAIDLSKQVRSYTTKNSPDAEGPGFMLTNDVSACGQSAFQEMNAEKLEVIDAANVSYVDIVMLNEGQVEPIGSVCFGYRVPDDGWHWVQGPDNLIPVAYDEETDRFSVRIPIAKGPIDGVKVFYDQGSRPVPTITYVVEP